MVQTPEQENRDLQSKISRLKIHLENLKSIVVGALVTVDWTLKIGLAVALWFFPIIQDRFIQSIGIAVYVILLTVVSKAIIKAKSYNIEV